MALKELQLTKGTLAETPGEICVCKLQLPVVHRGAFSHFLSAINGFRGVQPYKNTFSQHFISVHKGTEYKLSCAVMFTAADIVSIRPKSFFISFCATSVCLPPIIKVVN